jgi:hypothetical protein
MNSILRLDIIECCCYRRNSPNYFRIPKMTDNETLADLRNKVLCRAAKIQKLTEVEWTEAIYICNFSYNRWYNELPHSRLGVGFGNFKYEKIYQSNAEWIRRRNVKN